MFKNVSGQKFRVLAFDSATGKPKTGDAANITCSISKDFGAWADLGDTSATEEDATKANGIYLFDGTQAETNADIIGVMGRSTTSGIVVLGAPITIFTDPASFTSFNVTNANTLSGHDPGSTIGTGTSTLTQTQVTGGAYSVQSASCVLGDARIAHLDADVSSRGTSTLTQTQVTGGAYSIQSASCVLGDARIANLDAAVSTRSVYAGADTSGTTTLLSRVTSTRAGYFDNLNVGGAVASQADVQAINQSASKHLTLVTVGQYERPESGTVTYTVECRTFAAATGAAVNADSSPTLTATGSVTGSLAGNLSGITNPATGVYRWTYTVNSSDNIEQVRYDVSATITSATFTLSAYTQVCDLVSVTWNSTNASNLTAIFNKLPSANIASPADVWTNGTRALTDKTGFALTAAYDPAKTAAQAGDAMSLTSGERTTLTGVIWAALTSGLTTAGSIGKRLVDFMTTLVYGAPPTTAQIATAIFTDTTASDFTTAGSPGKILVTQLGGAFTTTSSSVFTVGALANAPSGGGSAPTVAQIDAQLSGTHGSGAWGSSAVGTGSRIVTITVNDGATVIQGALVRIFLNSSDNQVGATNASGVIAFSSCGDGTYTVVISYPGYTFTPTTLSVTANTSHTYSMTAVSLTPSAPGNTTGFTTCYAVNGSIEVGIVVFYRMIRPAKASGALVDGATLSVTSDNTGLVQFPNLIPGAGYEFRRTARGDRVNVDILATAGATFELPDLIG